MTKQVIWNLAAPIGPLPQHLAETEPTLVQFSGANAPTERDHQLLGAFVRNHQGTTVRFYGDAYSPDLSWLRHYAGVRRVSIEVEGVRSLEPLQALSPDLEQLTLSGDGKRRVSLGPIRRFSNLRDLTIAGFQTGIEAVADLRQLQRLSLISMKLPSLDVLEPLSELRSLELKLGGTTNLAALPRIGRLRYLELWRVRGLSDVSVLAEMVALQYLFLQHLKRVERLPSLRACSRLRRVHLDRVAITDLGPIAEAPRLEELLLLDMPQLSVEAFHALRAHPTLKAVTAGVHNETRRDEIRRLLGLDDVASYGTEFEYEPDVAEQPG